MDTMKNTERKKIYIAVADNLSKAKAYEYAQELGYHVVGDSGYLDDASSEICKGDVDMVICSGRLFDGKPKELIDKLPHHVRDGCDFLIISPIKNGTYRFKKLSTGKLRSKYDAVDNLLDYVRMPKTKNAYTLFKDALSIILSSPDSVCNITHSVYGALAEIHGANAKNIEYNMRSAKDRSLTRCSPDVIAEVFGELNDENSLELSLYLSKLADYLLKSSGR